MIEPEACRCGYHRYHDLPMTDVVAALLDRLPPSDRTVPRFDARGTRSASLVGDAPRLPVRPVRGIVRVSRSDRRPPGSRPVALQLRHRRGR